MTKSLRDLSPDDPEDVMTTALVEAGLSLFDARLVLNLLDAAKEVEIGDVMAARAIPVTIAGKTYDSMRQAARAFNVSAEIIRRRMKDGTLDDLAKDHPDSRRRQYRGPVTIRGVTYENQSAAARALGVHPVSIFVARKRGTLDRVGLRTS